MKSNYKRIGDFIRPIKVKNIDSSDKSLLGININKYFMPSVANVVGTDLSRYKIVKKGQFSCNRMHVGRDKRLPVALSNQEDDFIVSPAYDVFEIFDKNILLPEYLMMWFSRKEFDRNAWFYTDADVRGGLHWDAFCNMQLPVPDIEKQKAIVKEYNTIVNRIKLNEQLNQKLEETAQAIYKEWFVDFEFPMTKEYAESIGKPELEGKAYKSDGGEMVWNEELEKEIPVGWSVLPIKDYVVEMKNGGTPNRGVSEYWNSNDIPWLKTGEIENNIVVSAEEYISNQGFNNSSAKLFPKETVLMALYGVTAGQVAYLKFETTTNQACCGMICKDVKYASYLYYYLLDNQNKIANMAIGGAQPNLSKTIIEELQIIKPKYELFEKHHFEEIINYREKIEKENMILHKKENVILSKMAKA